MSCDMRFDDTNQITSGVNNILTDFVMIHVVIFHYFHCFITLFTVTSDFHTVTITYKSIELHT